MKQNAQELAATIRMVILTFKWKHWDLEMIQQIMLSLIWRAIQEKTLSII